MVLANFKVDGRCLWANDGGEQSKTKLSLSSLPCAIGTNSEPDYVKLQVCFPIRVQNITFNLNKLFLNHKMTFVDGQMDRQNLTNCLTPLFVSRARGNNCC